MKFAVQREELLKPLQAVAGVVERRQTMPILANFLLAAHGKTLTVTATDLEVELSASHDVTVSEEGEITVPGRKFLDICKALPDGAKITAALKGDRMLVTSGRSRFTLSTLPAPEFPTIEDIGAQQTIAVAQTELRRLLEKTQFAMAQQDVRYYLNGLLLELGDQKLRSVATDGHRLALCDIPLAHGGNTHQQVIIPRKGVLELHRMLTDDGDLRLSIGSNHIRAELDGLRFTSKLIDGRFPEYERVIPKGADQGIKADRGTLRQALQRTAILSNEKYRGIRLEIKDNNLTIQAHNPEQEEAEEEVEVGYDGSNMEIGFNVNYLLDALGALDQDEVEIRLSDPNSSCIIRDPGETHCTYVVMPMRQQRARSPGKHLQIKRLEIDSFRCLGRQCVEPDPSTNLIHGANASGKTSLLEAIYFLGRGRSFRTPNARELIQDGSEAFLLAADLDAAPGRIGVQASRDGLEARVGGEPSGGLAALAAALPVQVIEPGVHKLVEEGPSRRRAFVDWGVFHVEPAFLLAWRRFRRALKQRNAALRAGMSAADVQTWDPELVAAGGEVQRYRSAYLDMLAPVFVEFGRRLLDDDVALALRPGWRGESLADALSASRETDRARGATQVGPHRADVAVRYADHKAKARVSRGQQKLLAAALILAQLKCLGEADHESGVLLIDDPAAELDSTRLERFFELVDEVPAQRFITALEPAALARFSGAATFHVERGALRKMV